MLKRFSPCLDEQLNSNTNMKKYASNKYYVMSLEAIPLDDTITDGQSKFVSDLALVQVFPKKYFH